MNYGKSAYIKVVDLEQRLMGLSTNSSSYENYLEISKPSINQSFSKGYNLSVDFPPFDTKEGKNLCFQISASLSLPSATNISIDLSVNGSIIHSEKRSLATSGDILVFKTFTPLADGDLSLNITFATQDNVVATLKSISAVVLGASGSNISSDIELRALKTGDNILISYVDDNKLYKATVPALDTSLKADDFTYVDVAISHCYSTKSFEDDELNLYEVDTNGKLYLSSGQNKTMIAEDVLKVFACPCPSGGDYSNIVVYVKTNGLCYYKMVEGTKFTTETEFNFPSGDYVDILAVSRSDSKYIYVVASHKNGSNYIAKSLIDVATGKTIENLQISYFVQAVKYIDISFCKNIENIKLDVVFEITSENILNKLFDENSFATIKSTMSFTEKKYTIVQPVTYGVLIDPSNPDNNTWVSYCDDSQNYEPATYDPVNKIFNDNGWLDRWPISEIRPCLVKDGEVVGYLDKNDYTLFEDGTPSEITKKASGNVMVEFPEIYYKISKVDGKIKLNISNFEQEGFNNDAYFFNGKEHDKFYVAAYLCAGSDVLYYGLSCYSGRYVNASYALSYKSVYNLYFESSLDPEQYIIGMPYHFCNTLSCLYSIMFKTTKSIDVMGVGASSYNGSYKTGVYDKMGLFYGTSKVRSYPKLFGLEALYGIRETAVPGIWMDTDYKLHFADPKTNPNIKYTPTETLDYPTFDKDFVPANTDASTYVALDINGYNETGFFHMGTPNDKWSYDSTKGFCCQSSQKTSDNGGYMTFGLSPNSAQKHSGMFCQMLRNLDQAQSPAENIRFAMYPKT